ncbi:nuclear transport factor 2 family protein [Filimonas effusa]|nr:nuclear transport factor 2 family protein [Filimonas effusa]
MKKHAPLLHCLLFSLFLAPVLDAFAQETDAEVTAAIKQQDSLFWRAYNSCDTIAMAALFSEDVEFYHDKGGLTLGLPALMASMSTGMCNPNGTFRLRREEVTGTVKIFPLKKDKEVYGAIITGEHVFYVTQNGEKEFLDGHALFANVWRKQNGRWQMARVFSYDHGPATKPSSR